MRLAPGMKSQAEARGYIVITFLGDREKSCLVGAISGREKIAAKSAPAMPGEDNPLQILLHIHRQLDHSFQQIIGWDPLEIFKYQFFGKQAGDVANLQGLVSGGKDKVAMAVINYNHVFIFIIA